MANLAMNQGGHFVGGILPSKMLSARNVRANDAFRWSTCNIMLDDHVSIHA